MGTAAVLALQFASALLTLGFGLLALRVSRRAGRNRDRALAAWEPTAFCFTVVGAYGVAHALLCIFAAYAKSPAFRRVFLEWYHAANTGRALAIVAYAVVLAALLAGRRRWVLRLSANSLPLFAAAAVAGTLAGRWLDNGSSSQQMAQLGTLGGVTVLVLLCTLLMAVVNDGLDQLLWFALAAYTLKETMQVSMFAIIAWWSSNTSGAVVEAFYVLNALVLVGMVVLARRRLRLAAAGRHVPALFERIHARRHSSPA